MRVVMLNRWLGPARARKTGLLALMVVLAVNAQAQRLTAHMIHIGSGSSSFHLAEVPLVPAPTSSVDWPMVPLDVGRLGRAAWGLTADPDGRLLAIDAVNDTLLVIDSRTGTASELVSLSIDVGGQVALSHDRGGRLWMVDGCGLNLLDPATGRATPVVQIDRAVSGAFAWCGGSLFGGNGPDLFRIDERTGRTTLVTSYQGPGWVCAITALASDGRGLWGALPCRTGPAPGPVGPWGLARINTETGESRVVEWIAREGSQIPDELAITGAGAGVPRTAPLGAALLVIAAAAVALLRLP